MYMFEFAWLSGEVELYVWFGPASWAAFVDWLVEHLASTQNVMGPETAFFKMTVLGV